MAEPIYTGENLIVSEAAQQHLVPFAKGQIIVEDSGSMYYDPTTGTSVLNRLCLGGLSRTTNQSSSSDSEVVVETNSVNAINLTQGTTSALILIGSKVENGNEIRLEVSCAEDTILDIQGTDDIKVTGNTEVYANSGDIVYITVKAFATKWVVTDVILDGNYNTVIHTSV